MTSFSTPVDNILQLEIYYIGLHVWQWQCKIYANKSGCLRALGPPWRIEWRYIVPIDTASLYTLHIYTYIRNTHPLVSLSLFGFRDVSIWSPNPRVYSIYFGYGGGDNCARPKLSFRIPNDTYRSTNGRISAALYLVFIYLMLVFWRLKFGRVEFR